MNSKKSQASPLQINSLYPAASCINSGSWVTGEGRLIDTTQLCATGLLRISTSSEWCHSLQPKDSKRATHPGASPSPSKFPVAGKAVDAVPLRREASHFRGWALVVEEDEQVRSLIGIILERMGFSTLLASSGDEALRLIEQHQAKIRFSVLDLCLPGIGGKTIFEALQQDHPSIPVLFTSGYSQTQIRAVLPDVENHTLLRKPWTAQELSVAVEKLWTTKPHREFC